MSHTRPRCKTEGMLKDGYLYIPKLPSPSTAPQRQHLRTHLLRLQP